MPIIHFNQIMICSPASHIQSTWLAPHDEQGVRYDRYQYWQKIAQILEQGRFDGMFFADAPSVGTEYALETIAFGGGIKYDPLAIVPLMASATSNIGFGVTLSTAGTPPHLAVRRLGTIDNLTGGRFGWNVVTGFQKSDFQALGIDQPPHDERYDAADEYMEICYKLWDAFPRDAVLADKKNKIYMDVDKIKRVDFHGKYYRCEAYPVVQQSSQGRPVIFQAGSSGRGMRFAAEHADAIFALPPTIRAMKKYIDTLKEIVHIRKLDRVPKVYLGIQPYIGKSAGEAYEKFKELKDNIPMDVALNRLGSVVGFDFRGWDIDKPLEDVNTDASRGLLEAMIEWGKGGSPSIREAALQMAMSSSMPQLFGTPIEIADQIEHIWRQTGCYGFNLSPHITPVCFEDFVDLVVPILQSRGLARTAYTGTTYRDNILQQSPA